MDISSNSTIPIYLNDSANVIALQNASFSVINLNNDTVLYLLNNITNSTIKRHRNLLTISDFDRILIKISQMAGYVYMLLAILGLFLNKHVIIRLIQLAYKDYDRFKNGCGLPLLSMSAADFICLLSIIFTVTSNTFIPSDYFSVTARSLQCKITMFSIHSATSFSTWCWLFVSVLRYMAVYHPLWNISNREFGYGTLFCMLFFILITNSWLLLSVVGFRHTCGEKPLLKNYDLNRLIHGCDLFINYIIPVILTFALDVRVLITRPPEFNTLKAAPSIDLLSKITKSNKVNPKRRCTLLSFFEKNKEQERLMSPNLHSVNSMNDNVTKNNIDVVNSNKRSNHKNLIRHHSIRARSAVLRWLTITTIDLLFNTPDNILRITSILSIITVKKQNSSEYHLFALIARLLYFTQFCFNAFYLSTIVYKRNIESQKSRQQRLKHVWCKNCNQMHDFNLKCYSSLLTVTENRIQRRCSNEPMRKKSSLIKQGKSDSLPIALESIP